jgi:hypothetical protein
MISYLLLILLIVLFGWVGAVISPLFFGLFRQQLHRCPKCLNAIKEKSIFNSLEDNVCLAIEFNDIDSFN